MAMLSLDFLDQWTVYLFGALVVLLSYQQWRLYQLRKESAKREELFRIVAENAADMIALVDVKGHRLYNSPAYERILGYSPAELAKTPIFEQIHPEDRYKVLEAGREARDTGVGKPLRYRVKHKNGKWRILESTANAIKNAEGDVEKLVIVNRDITDRRIAEEQLEHNSFHDALTGLPNRRLFLDRLQHSFVRAQRNTGYQYAILFVDLDGFKSYNDLLGPQAADEVIMEIGRRMAACLRQDDTVARAADKLPDSDVVLSRLGGDEFTILLESIKDPSDAMRVARRIQAAVAEPVKVEGQTIVPSASIGIALSAAPQEKAEDILHDAETAMRRAKSLGGSRSEVFDEGMHARAVSRLQLESELRTAFSQNQFRVYYHPIMHLQNKQTAGFEALVRWHHPQQGVISPNKFLNAAEDIGLLAAVGRWVSMQACRQLATWRAKYPNVDLHMAVNVSAKQFAHANFVGDIRDALQENRIEPARLHLEVSESIAMADATFSSNVFAQLSHLGIGLSLDDFGVGSSSLVWLRRFSIDTLKIDRSLVAGIPTDRSSADTVELITTLAHHLGLKVVAEGVESAVHLERLRKMACELGQGYFFAQPLDAEHAEEFLRQHRARAAAAE